MNNQKTGIFLTIGFRPLFLLAGLSAVFLVILWTFMIAGVYRPITTPILAGVHWHAHEMIYGYGMAVIAGFLLTAVRNWTGIQTLRGKALAMLCLVWLVARLVPFIPFQHALLISAVLNLLFGLLICIAIYQPIAKAKQWKQMSILSKLVFLLAGNLLFWLGVFGIVEEGIRMGLYTGLYIIVSLIMLMGRRVIPFFIEKGVDYPVKLKNYRWLDITSLLLMLVFLVIEVYIPLPGWSAPVALLLGILHLFRLAGWYTPGIWRRPLLWVLYLGYAWMIAGFLLNASTHYFGTPSHLAVHAFAYGCIGMVTLGMMARVSLAHSGRNIASPPPGLDLAFILLLTGAVVRSLIPLLLPQHYLELMYLSQAIWILAFLIFISGYWKILAGPEPSSEDGSCPISIKTN